MSLTYQIFSSLHTFVELSCVTHYCLFLYVFDSLKTSPSRVKVLFRSVFHRKLYVSYRSTLSKIFHHAPRTLLIKSLSFVKFVYTPSTFRIPHWIFVTYMLHPQSGYTYLMHFILLFGSFCSYLFVVLGSYGSPS